MVEHIVEGIIQARKAKQILSKDDIELLSGLSLNDAYNIQEMVISQGHFKVAGWKLGGSNQKTRELFRVNEVYWGPVFEGDLHHSTDELVLSQGEVEIAFRFNDRIDSIAGNVNESTVRDIISSVALSMEFPWSVFPDFGSTGIVGLVSDCCASGECLLGVEIDIADFNNFENIKILVDGNLVEIGGSGSLIGGPLQVLCDFINSANTRGFGLKEGQWVFTGGISSCRRFEAGSVVEVVSDTLSDMTFIVSEKGGF